MLKTTLRAAGLAAVLAASLSAQVQFLPLGNQIMDGSQNMVTVNLGFSFTMPGGNVVTALDVDEHGRLVEVGTDPSDSSETTGEMTGNPTGSINVLWDFNSYSAANNAGVYFYTDNATVATITWVNVVFIGAPCTYQVQLYASGEIAMVYDSNCPADDGIIGVCPGNGATLPAQSNLSDAITVGPIVTADPTVFEDFGFTAGVDAFDIPSSGLMFIPSGAGGANGWTVVGNAGVTDPLLPFATAENYGGGCFNKVSFTYVPNAAGGYDVTAGPSQFDPNIGALAGATADDTITAIGLDLGFQMQFPDGSIHQFVDIDPNGRILPTGVGAGDFSPSLADLHGDGYPMICPLWSDWNVTESTSDGIYFNTNPGVSATFTWNSVGQFSADPAPTSTFQITLYNGGTFVITLEDLSNYNNTTSADDTIIGCSTGVAPGTEIDHTALPATTSLPAYEFWDSSGTSPVEPFTLTVQTPDLVALTRPIQGASWDLQAQGVDASTQFGFYIIGLNQVSVDLTPFGSPCTQSVSADILDVKLPDGLGNLNTYSLAVPASPVLTGFNINVQAATAVPPGTQGFSAFLGLPFALIFSNAVDGRVGSL